MDPRIWITTHGLYNAGALIGYWLSPGEGYDEEEVFTTLRSMVAEQAPSLANDIGEELMVCDHEGWQGLDPKEFSPSEWEEVAGLIEEDEVKVALLVECHGVHYYTSADHLRRALDDLTYYSGSSKGDVAEEYCEQTGVLGGIPERLRYYFDCEAFVRDLVLSGDATECRVDGEYYLVFAD